MNKPEPVVHRRVRVLAPDVATQIAAGEVVERPASVVKELVENALDAGARRITVELEGAGTSLIAVVDDGDGMDAEDAVCAFARHATSKVASVEDLQRITTMGFRGEALASIAAVARVTLVTRRAEDVGGHRVDVRYGTIADVRAAGTPPGTRVEVADLFGNTPARRKFLKAPGTEVGHVTELVTRTALAWPRVAFVLKNAGRTLLELAAVEDDSERVRQIFGDERAAAMLGFASRGPAGTTGGWLSDPQLTFPTARHIYTYVNRRYVRDKLVSHALVAGYTTLLMHGRYPAAVVFLDLPLEDVDVNVHPAKSEVRFRRAGAVHELLAHAVQERLRGEASERLSSPPPSWRVPTAANAASMGSHAPPLTLRLVDRSPPEESASAGVLPPWPPVPGTVPAAEACSGAVTVLPARAGFFSSLRIVGQIFEGYIVAENGSDLVFIDQHAAHERVTFEQLRAAYGMGGIARQGLLVPVVVDLGAREAALVNEWVRELDALGFEVEPFGGTSFAVRAVPALLGDADPAGLLRDVGEELVEFGRIRRLDEAAHSVLARLACHSAVRVGQNLGAYQIRALLGAMDRIDFAGNCPHGRPAFITVPRGELERWFKRT